MTTITNGFILTVLAASGTFLGCHGGAADDPVEPTPVAQTSTAPTAGIAIDEARVAALAKVPGTVLEEEYEKEDGQWIYSFEIRPDGAAAGIVNEVHVDANNAAILKVEVETGDDNSDESDKDDEDDDDENDDD